MKQSLLACTNAYKILSKDVQSGNLSHAYLFVCQDERSLRDYLKEFAKVVVCGTPDYDENSRPATLIDKERHPDVTFYPNGDKKIVVDDVDDLVENSFVKPFEADNKVFVLVNASQMNPQAQNKLLKTLEEPPQGVCILIGTTGEYRLLSTVLSRVKKLTVPDFSDKQLFDYLKDKFTDHKRLKTAIALSGGKKGEAERIYSDETSLKMRDFAIDVLCKMNSSKKVLEYSGKIDKDNVEEFLGVMAVVLRDVLSYKNGGETIILTDADLVRMEDTIDGLKSGAVLDILNRINALNRARYFNANVNMTVDEVLFAVLEERYKWQKL